MLLLVQWSRWIGGAVVVHHPVLWRSTTGWNSHNLPLLGFLVDTDGVVHDHDVADELWECPSHVEHHALLYLGGEIDHEVVLLLLIGVHLIRRILCQMVELLGVVVHGPSSLLEVHELLVLLSHHACRDVVGVEGTAELSPWHLVIRRASGGVVGPQHAGVTPQLLCGEEGLLHLGAAQEPELGLHHPKPVVGLQRLSCLGEERRVHSREVTVGGRSWSIPYPFATTGGVGNELPRQLDLLIVGLKDRGDRLSQTWRWRRVPVPLGVLGPISHVTSVHHSAIQIGYH
jgi:hypothetical protein